MGLQTVPRVNYTSLNYFLRSPLAESYSTKHRRTLPSTSVGSTKAGSFSGEKPTRDWEEPKSRTRDTCEHPQTAESEQLARLTGMANSPYQAVSLKLFYFSRVSHASRRTTSPTPSPTQPLTSCRSD